MVMKQETAIALAMSFANANGFRVVPSFEGVEWVDTPLPVKFSNACRIPDEVAEAQGIDGGWWVVFEKLLHPELSFECPGAICVLVAESRECRFYRLL
jgi:hypothetical protein